MNEPKSYLIDMELLKKRMAAHGHKTDDAVLIVMSSITPDSRLQDMTDDNEARRERYSQAADAERRNGDHDAHLFFLGAVWALDNILHAENAEENLDAFAEGYTDD